MHGMAEGREIDRRGQEPVARTIDGLWQPRRLPGCGKHQKLGVHDPGRCAKQQRDNLGLAVELCVQFGLPTRLHLLGQGKYELPGQRAMRRDQERRHARLLSWRNAADGIERAEECVHVGTVVRGMARRWSWSGGKGKSAPPASSGAIQTDFSPLHFPARTFSAKFASRSAVSAGFSSVKA